MRAGVSPGGCVCLFGDLWLSLSGLPLDGMENFAPCMTADSSVSFPHDFDSCTVDLGLFCCGCDGSLQDLRARTSRGCNTEGMIRERSTYIRILSISYYMCIA